VHGHWLLARLVRRFPDAAFVPHACGAGANLEPENIAGEVAYLQHAGRAFPSDRMDSRGSCGSRRNCVRGKIHAAGVGCNLAPPRPEAAAHSRVLPDLYYPIRIGEHDQTAFSFGLMWDWAGVAGACRNAATTRGCRATLYLRDRNCPLSYEPSGQDFLSPCLAEADFMRRVLDHAAFARWLKEFLPSIPRNAKGEWLPAAVVTNRADPKLAHLDGLNLSRAWMLEGIAHGLDAKDARVPALLAAAQRHRAAALPEITGEHYEGGHWLGTFAVYLLTDARN
jgi:hypothetical protein